MRELIAPLMATIVIAVALVSAHAETIQLERQHGIYFRYNRMASADPNPASTPRTVVR